MHVEYTVSKMFARINLGTLTCMQMRFVCNMQNNCNSSTGNMARSAHSSYSVTCSCCTDTRMCDRSKLRHDCVAVASEDAILPLPFHSHR